MGLVRKFWSFRAQARADKIIIAQITVQMGWLISALSLKAYNCEGPIFIYLFEVLAFELRASWLLGRSSTTGAIPPALFALVIFALEIGSCFLPRLA
jgi:hypothetical protein